MKKGDTVLIKATVLIVGAGMHQVLAAGAFPIVVGDEDIEPVRENADPKKRVAELDDRPDRDRRLIESALLTKIENLQLEAGKLAAHLDARSSPEEYEDDTTVSKTLLEEAARLKVLAKEFKS